MLSDVVVVVIRTRPRAILFSAIFSTRKTGVFVITCMGLRLAPFRPPELRHKNVQDRKGSSKNTPLRRASTNFAQERDAIVIV